MGNKQQTAVEWLIEQLEQHHVKIDIKNTVVYQQAKAMEKKQIIDARLSLDKSDNIWDSAIAFEEAEKYYKETYGE
jgi:hypothetical protein